MKFLVLVVTKQRHLRKNLVTKRCYPEQTLSPNGVTQNKSCHQTVSPGKNVVTKLRYLGKNLVTKWCHLGTNPVTKSKNLRVGQGRSGQVRTGQDR